ncbi:MAG: SAM-dependent methyltransferase, partial [Firmicutes bacterium]|nr:SAM-dependent methyltransferase [Bacillota bacterium]
GAYFRLVDMGSEEEKQAGLLEALANPDCGWFYRATSTTFESLPGSQIGYWATPGIVRIFSRCKPFGETMAFREGIHTANNDIFLKLWWEPSKKLLVRTANRTEDIDELGRWVPYCKGGQFRKWYGNFDYVIGFDGTYREKMKSHPGCVWPSQALWYKEGGTWTAISSGSIGVRYYPSGCLFDAGGQVLVGENCLEAIAAINSSIYLRIAELTMPTLNYKCGVIKTLPDIRTKDNRVLALSEECVQLGKKDWDAFETSLDFRRHPLV